MSLGRRLEAIGVGRLASYFSRSTVAALPWRRYAQVGRSVSPRCSSVRRRIGKGENVPVFRVRDLAYLSQLNGASPLSLCRRYTVLTSRLGLGCHDVQRATCERGARWHTRFQPTLNARLTRVDTHEEEKKRGREKKEEGGGERER